MSTGNNYLFVLMNIWLINDERGRVFSCLLKNVICCIKLYIGTILLLKIILQRNQFHIKKNAHCIYGMMFYLYFNNRP